jgi:formylglycine-generating enzyme required for sulfatase activity
MHRSSLLSSTALAIAASALLPTALSAQTPAAADAPNDVLRGLPAFLLPVPGGTVEMGLSSEALIQASCQAANPLRPADAPKAALEKLQTAMRLTSLSLGVRKVQVEGFLLGKWPVKNSEYEAYVLARRAAGHKVRVPYHWWRYGKQDDFKSRHEEIGREFPKAEDAVVSYWEAHGHELPYALVDENGKSIADQPVANLFYRDALEFAAWLGMRLPTEAEFTRAARGDGSHRWPWGKAKDDVYNEAGINWLGLGSMAGQRMVDVGAIANAAGPYGHLDMFGRVWQFISSNGSRYINGREAFDEQWKLLQKDKVGALLASPMTIDETRNLAKGGCYLSWQSPIQLLIDSRARVGAIEIGNGVGLRLCKSQRPGFDMLYSLVRGIYNRSAFALDQKLDEANQVGAERYELNDAGFPTAYHAVSFMPVSWLSPEKNAELGKLLDKSQGSPLLIGTLATTEKLMLASELEPGLFTVQYRKAGMPKELVEAIKQGHKDLVAARKGKPKADEKKADEKGGDEKDAKKQDEGKRPSWREQITRAGLTDAEVEQAENGVLKFVRIDGTQVPTDDDVFLLLDGTEGKVVGVVPATSHRPAVGKAFASELTVEKGAGDKAVAKLRFGVPLRGTDTKVVGEFRLHLPLGCAVPSAAAPWRLPTAANAGSAPAAAPAAGAAGAAAEKPATPAPSGK